MTVTPEVTESGVVSVGTAPDPLWTGPSAHVCVGWDDRGCVTHWNTAASGLLGYDAKDILGMACSMLLDETKETGNPLHSLMDQARRVGFFGGAVTLRHKDGHPIRCAVLLVPRLRRSGDFDGFQLMVPQRMVPQLMVPLSAPTVGHVEETIDRLRAQIDARDAVNRSKDVFLSRMLHDLRTPVGGIVGFAATLLMKFSGPLTAQQEQHIKIIEGCGKDLLRQMDRLPDAMRIETGTVNVQWSDVSCWEVIEREAPGWRDRAAAKGLTFNVVISDGDGRLVTDPAIVTQILERLVDNAIASTEQGGIVIACQSSIQAPGTVCIMVRDTGIGLSVEEQGKLFLPFTLLRAPSGRRRGLGLGLHQSRKLANLIHGEVSCVSEAGHGSAFTLTVKGHDGHGTDPGD